MAKGMTMKELKSHSAEAKGKDLPYKVSKRKIEHAGHGRSHRNGKW